MELLLQHYNGIKVLLTLTEVCRRGLGGGWRGQTASLGELLELSWQPGGLLEASWNALGALLEASGAEKKIS